MSEHKNPYPVHHWSQQSPINLTKMESLYVKYPKSFFKVDYRDAPFEGCFVGEEGHRNFVLSESPPGKKPPTISLGDATAELQKIHLHTPSEHDVEGADLGGEIHLIHKILTPNAGSEFVVLGIFFNESQSPAKTDFFSTWAAEMSKTKRSQAEQVCITLDPRKLLPSTDKWYRYEGSLTSEPYSEIISWLVFVEPLGIDSADFRKLKKYAHQPERPVQPLHRRFVIRNFT